VFLESERAALPYGYFARNLPAHMPALGEAIDVISALEGPSL
jgi:hypothetical protein